MSNTVVDIKHLARKFADLWFQPEQPYDLAIARLIFFGYALVNEWDQVFWWTVLPSGIAHYPGIMAWFPLLPANQLEILLWFVRIVTVFAFVGVFYRTAAPLAALGLLYFIGLENGYGKIMHSSSLYVLGLLVLSVSRSDDAFSIKAWLNRDVQPTPSGEYRWPLRAVWLSIAGMYCAAGVSKLIKSGWAWALGNNFRDTLIAHLYESEPPTQWGAWFVQHPELCRAMAIGALLLELIAPLLLFGGWYTFVVGGGLLALQLGIFLLMGVKFGAMVPVFLTLIPWTWLWFKLKRQRAVSRLANSVVAGQHQA